MNSKAIESLMKIAAIEGIHPSMGAIAREEALRQWIRENIVEVGIEQAVIKKGLTDEDEKFIKSYVTSRITEDLFDECARYEVTDKRVIGKVWALRG